MAEITVHYEGPVVTRAKATDVGAAYYFTGRPCLRGHLALRYVSTRTCLACFGRRPGSIPESITVHYHGPLITRKEALARGLKRYFTGKPCKRGHIAERYCLTPQCLACAECANRERYATQGDRIRKSAAAYRAANPEKARQTVQRWREAFPARVAQAVAAWNRSHPEARAAINARRRARELGASGSLTAEDVRQIFALQRGRCAICGGKIRGTFHVDHIVALARGGAHDRSNIQVTHPRCNLRKGAKDPLVFAREQGLLL